MSVWDAVDDSTTLCPGSPTLCPGSPTLCPGSPTLCPGSPTLCPGSPTSDEASHGITTASSFDDEAVLNLSDSVLRGVYSAGFERPSKIQSTATPALLQGRDVLAQAPSGTGKTAAFLIAATELCVRRGRCAGGPGTVRNHGPLVTVLLHTRELAHQTYAVARDIAQYTTVRIELVVGGAPRTSGADGVPDIAIATPGKLDQLVSKKILSMGDTELLVVDEVDEMLRDVQSNSFLEVVERIISCVPQTAQIGLFSATLPESVQAMVSEMLRDPVRVLVPAQELSLAGIDQRVRSLSDSGHKFDAVVEALHSVASAQSMVFCATREIAHEVAEGLKKIGAQAAALHGDMDPGARRTAMQLFREGRTSVLVCTLVLARGVDVQQVNLVILHDVPTNAETYMHCVGRCGRYGRKGVSVALSMPYDEALLRSIERDYGARMVRL